MKIKYNSWEAHKIDAIYLDNILQKDVKEVDADKGYIIRYKMVNGRPIIENDHFITERVEGDVKIYWK